MLRLRRYRVYLVFAIIAIGLLYHFTNVRDWEGAKANRLEGLSGLGVKDATTLSSGPVVEVGQTPLSEKASRLSSLAIQTPTSLTGEEEQTLTTSITSSSSRSSSSIPTSGIKNGIQEELRIGADVAPWSATFQLAPSTTAPSKYGDLEEQGQGRHDISAYGETASKIHWLPLTEHFPVPSEKLISLPTGSPKPLRKIQYQFKDESSNAKIDRERKLDEIKQLFVRSWAGYKGKAWLHDELSPISGKFRDPFCGWAATLVDALDTLWIMGLNDDFDQAAKAVDGIDFTTTPRNDIPLFETTIRYLGGLIGAYDLSGSRYRNLLKKAIELADVLIGSFDTPNRMPMTYYYWKPTLASQAHRASTRVVLAELGSLSVEFTRLAQITKENKYYDAIARITNEFEIWQNRTQMPGLWPHSVDASGCKKPEMKTTPLEQAVLHGGPDAIFESDSQALSNNSKPIFAGEVAKIAEPMSTAQRGASETPQRLEPSSTDGSRNKASLVPRKISPVEPSIARRQLEFGNLAVPTTLRKPKGSDIPQVVTSMKQDCEPQGLASPPKMGVETFGLGGGSDSTYEYLPKEYILLGGLNDQYRKMYEQSIDTVTKHLLYRPMIPGDRNVLMSGTAKVIGGLDGPESYKLVTEGTHLTCFAGGMFAVGSKIFERETDMDIAAKLTDGCVWAYETTATGIMAEDFLLMDCGDKIDCIWNETRWHQELDPNQEARDRQRELQNQRERATPKTVLQGSPANIPVSPPSTVAPGNSLPKRQIRTLEPLPAQQASNEVADAIVATTGVGSPEYKSIHLMDFDKKTQDVPTYKEATSNAAKAASHKNATQWHLMTHDDFVAARIEGEKLPPGITSIKSRKYMLRPEAIESVFIMYRATGDDYWRDKGWTMFKAIRNYTWAEYGNSAIQDVTSEIPLGTDNMESFWLAETLKYFYLLFSDPSVVSLDDYVLNTEAHPFKRPR